MMIVVAIAVLLSIEHTPIASWLGINSLTSWQRILLAGGMVTLTAAIVGLVISYRKQRDTEEGRTNIQFAEAAAQLGGNSASVRIAGVYAMAALADRSPTLRQRCIDVLCGHLRIPYDPEGESRKVLTRTIEDRLATRTHTETYQFVPGEREVRLTIIRVIRDHLRPNAPNNWCGYDFDFTGVVFEDGDFQGAHFTGGQVSFERAQFVSGLSTFNNSVFSGAQVYFTYSQFSGGSAAFIEAEFSDGYVSFLGATFSRSRVLFRATFSGGHVSFGLATFSGGAVSFAEAVFSGGTVSFSGALFTGGELSFNDAKFTGTEISFSYAKFFGLALIFQEALFSSGEISFHKSEIQKGTISFDWARLIGTEIDFSSAQFHGGQVNFSQVLEWETPPLVPEVVPEGLLLPPSTKAGK